MGFDFSGDQGSVVESMVERQKWTRKWRTGGIPSRHSQRFRTSKSHDFLVQTVHRWQTNLSFPCSLDHGSTLQFPIILSHYCNIHNPEEPAESTVFPTERLGASSACCASHSNTSSALNTDTNKGRRRKQIARRGEREWKQNSCTHTTLVTERRTPLSTHQTLVCV
ncbi:hypothetical protein BJV77DRAFT_791597 [Russula vinacea]|jgi:hypothetical protein|nr:hypothetical protein BJV77DRAFT_791597 [Russula vinacea]